MADAVMTVARCLVVIGLLGRELVFNASLARGEGSANFFVKSCQVVFDQTAVNLQLNVATCAE